MIRWLTALALAIAVGFSLTACESTQDKAAKIQAAAEANTSVEAGLELGQPSKDVKVGATTLLSDENGDAVVVEVQNTSNQPLVNVPILVDLQDAKGKSLFKNDAPGLEPSLNHIPLMKPGETVEWVNDQLSPSTKPAKAKVTVGTPTDKPPAQIPEIVASPPRLKENPVTGVEVEGTVTNKSQIDQTKLVLFAVAKSGGKIVAAGRGQIKALKVGAKPGTYNIFFIGDPHGADVTVQAPPSVLQ